MADPSVKNKMENDGFNITNSSPAEFETQVRSESKRWAELIRDEKIKVD